MNLDRFKQQHVEILQTIAQMRKHVHAGIPENADAIARGIMALRTKVNLHLSVEDRVLYPQIHKLDDERLVRLAKTYQDEMQGLAGAFVEFCSRWTFAKAIAAQPEEFRQDANTVMKALHERVQRENTEFYPRLEQSVS